MNPENFIRQVDPEVYLYCHRLYSAATGLKMPMDSPSNKPVLRDGNSVYSLSNTPLNRGMLAITKELKQIGLPESQRMSMVNRVMEFGGLLDKAELSEFIKSGPTSDQIMVSEALIRACATARIIVDGDHMGFDVADVAQIAKEISEDEEQGD